jgi:hypothetical protein
MYTVKEIINAGKKESRVIMMNTSTEDDRSPFSPIFKSISGEALTLS